MTQIFDLAGIGGAVVGDLEAEITKMDAEIRLLEAELQKAERFKAEYAKLSELWRDHLDEADIEDDSEWESQARQILWNDSDTEKQWAIEDAEEEANNAAWFEMNVGE